MGLEAQFFDRISNEAKSAREGNNSQTFIWEPFARHSGEKKQILTHIFKKTSGWPEHFKVDMLGEDDPFIMDPTLQGYNKELKTNQFLNICQEAADSSPSKYNIIIPFGGESAYLNAMTNWE